MLPSIAQIDWRRYVPFQQRTHYHRLPTSDIKKNSYPFGLRWRSPSPDRFSLRLRRTSLARILIIVTVTLFCLGLMLIGGIRRHHSNPNTPQPAAEQYPWQKFPMYVFSWCIARVRVTDTQLD
jgi:hypothetical protein